MIDVASGFVLFSAHSLLSHHLAASFTSFPPSLLPPPSPLVIRRYTKCPSPSFPLLATPSSACMCFYVAVELLHFGSIWLCAFVPEVFGLLCVYGFPQPGWTP
jgi:hypothetical protein